MGNRCPSCNKMASLETEAEEPEGLEYDPGSGLVTGTIRVVRKSECCGEELREATFDIEAEVGVDEDSKDGDEYEVEVGSYEETESGGGRYAANKVGFSLDGKVVRRRDGKETEIGTFDAADAMNASAYDELT
jgi:hypothetical protein